MEEELSNDQKLFIGFLVGMDKETDRGVALSGAAWIDELLKQTILAFLVEKSGPDLVEEYPSPLSEFAARIAAAHALGLISDAEKHECTLVRKNRNEFAHRIVISFDDAKVAGLCSALRMNGRGDGRTARRRFTESSLAILINLKYRPHYVAQSRLRSRDWPIGAP